MQSIEWSYCIPCILCNKERKRTLVYQLIQMLLNWQGKLKNIYDNRLVLDVYSHTYLLCVNTKRFLQLRWKQTLNFALVNIQKKFYCLYAPPSLLILREKTVQFTKQSLPKISKASKLIRESFVNSNVVRINKI